MTDIGCAYGRTPSYGLIWRVTCKLPPSSYPLGGTAHSQRQANACGCDLGAGLGVLYLAYQVIVCVGSSSLLLSPFAARVTYVRWSPPGALNPAQFVCSIMMNQPHCSFPDIVSLSSFEKSFFLLQC